MCLSFAHGAKDTANATGAFAAVWLVYSEGMQACGMKETPVWIMAVAGAFVFIGMNALGYKVRRRTDQYSTSFYAGNGKGEGGRWRNRFGVVTRSHSYSDADF